MAQDNKAIHLIGDVKHEYNSKYSQSSNSLFHFMSKKDYLLDALKRKALIPRYVIEDIKYLNLKVSGEVFNELLVLQKCFCDIPLSRIIVEGDLRQSDLEEEKSNPIKMSHLDIYGNYAIAFSKEYCSDINLHPIHYINEKSSIISHFKQLFDKSINEESLDDSVANYIIHNLSIMKPLSGSMLRTNYDKVAGQEKSYLLHKIFHDEQEWRYIPSQESINKVNQQGNIEKLELLYANNYLWKDANMNFVNQLNNQIADDKFADLWMKFEYSNIEYILVPTANEKESLISDIIEIEDNKFDQNNNDVLFNKLDLASKIIVIEDIKKDW